MPGEERVVFLIDAGEVLITTVGGLTLSPYLVRASPLPEGAVREIVRSTLFVSEDTPQLRADVAERLQIGVEVLEGYQSAEARWRPGAVSALAHMHAMGMQAAIVTNVSPWDAAHVALLREVAARVEMEVHPSYELGLAKPDPGLFHLLARRYQVEPKNMVLLDDQWDYLAPARDLGIRGIWFSEHPALETSEGRTDVRIARTWDDAMPIVQELAETGFRHRQPRDHDVRAVVVIVNSHSKIPIEHGILDPPSTWHLPGGGVQPDEQPREAVQREAREELGIAIQLAEVEHVVKIPALDGHRAQIVYVYQATTEATQLHPWLAELDDARWVTVDEALTLLYPDPGDAALLRHILPTLPAGQDMHAQPPS